MKRYGDSPKKGHKYTLRPGAYAILPRDGKILVTYQAAPHFEHQLPGGGIDPGESPVQALHREVFEETGWRIARPLRIGAFRRFVYMPEYDINAEKICHIYLARPVRPHGPPREPGHTAVWLPPQEALHAIANEGDAAFLASLIN
ncbi:NUDIX hydrolase [Loktanella sp. S4079]|uniref:NUDIX hydrolase n=1 Tax=Loktanella sp. S4079 TaxID=579483 RepID=UPI0005FA734F|nr:NUDIX hydrolase [Loktanella sp. S4079]KJZ19394.1 NUDIX hydrolase [Loktanella sp. S4079]